MSSPPHVPFVRPLYGSPHQSKPGADVVAVARALSRAGHLKWQDPFSPAFNAAKVKAVKEFQHSAHIQPTGNYGHLTHQALVATRAVDHPGEWAFDAYSASIMHAAATQKSPARKAADALFAAASYWIQQRSRIHYAEVRPFPLVKPPALPGTTDCSGFVTACFYAAGAPDPNGRGYDGLGYTGTLVGRGQRVTESQARPFSLVFYGHTTHPSPAFPPGSPTHVALYLGGGYVASHGSEPGPLKLPIRYRGDVNQIRQYPYT